MIIFLDAGPVAGGVGLFVGVGLFLVIAAVAFIAFKMMKRTVKMAFRMAVLAVILIIALVGGISIWWLVGGRTTSPGPPKPRPTQTK